METTWNKPSRSHMSDSTREKIVNTICYLFVLLFLYAATSKLMDYDKFLVQMSKSPFITDYAGVLVWMVPGIEIIISILLLIDRTKMTGLFASFVLMCLFTTYIYAILNFSETIPCSCGGVLERLEWSDHLIFNILFILLGVIGIFLHTKKTNSVPRL